MEINRERRYKKQRTATTVTITHAFTRTTNVGGEIGIYGRLLDSRPVSALNQVGIHAHCHMLVDYAGTTVVYFLYQVLEHSGVVSPIVSNPSCTYKLLKIRIKSIIFQVDI